MDFLTRFGLNKGRLTVLVMIGLLLQGLITYSGLPKRENPAITMRSAIVTAQFPGMSPERMEDLIVIPIERAAREIGEVEDIDTLISTGFTKINLTVYDAIPKADIDRVFQDIRNKMADIASDLPEGTKGPTVNTNFGDVSIATVAITGDGFSYRELKESADDLREDLYKLNGISKVSIFGEQEERIWLEIDSRKLASIGVQINQVLSDLQAQNVILPAGELNSEGTTLILEANGDLDSVEAIGDVLTKVQGLSGFVRLRDLMNVRRGYQDPDNKPVFFNGEPAVVLAVEMTDNQDIQQIGAVLKDRVEAYEQTQPIGISYSFSTFQETAVTQSINAALMNVLQTFAVVVLVMMVFLGFRVAFIIACIVPFTLMFALMGMSYMGIDLHQISIAAVIISLGLLVDNGLVVVEDIQGRVSKGVPVKDAAIGAGGQFFVPLAIASITTIAAFTPMFILEGVSGEFAFSLGAVVALMLFGSWLTAHYILPYLCVLMLKIKKDDAPNENSKLVILYRGAITHILPFGIPIILLAYFTVYLSSNVFGLLKSEMFPLSERAEYMIYLDMPKGTAISQTKKEALAVEQWLLNKDINTEVVNTTVFVGDGGPRFYLALSPADTNPSSAFILVNTVDAAGAIKAGERAKRYLIENHPAARFKIKRLSMGGAESGIVEIKLNGPDLDHLLALAKEVEGAFDTVPGIGQNENNWGNKSLKMVIDIAQNKAREFGVTSKEISDVMDAYFSGTSYSTYREGSDSIPIVLRASENFRDSLEDLANLSIPAGGNLIALDQVATFRPQLEYSQFRRQNQERQIIISGKSETLGADAVGRILKPTLDGLDLSGGHSMVIGGETEESAETNANLAAGLPLGLTIMLLALMYQFNSARRVILTFMTIPLIVTGAPLALYFSGQPMSFFAILGLISLMGIIINNAIVLIDQIDIDRGKLELREAIISAAGKRVTPIILTSLTTILGLLPMAISGGALFEPMATLMIGGLLLSSTMSLFFVPSVYYLFFRFDRSAQ
jgi:multidrug efflux pump subunit AcrB